MIETFRPWPTARNATPKAAVDFPFPFPVFTKSRPREFIKKTCGWSRCPARRHCFRDLNRRAGLRKKFESQHRGTRRECSYLESSARNLQHVPGHRQQIRLREV